MIRRALQPVLEKSKKGVLLLGPRQTGKSTLIRALSPDLTVNLAHEPTYLDFARNPKELEERLAAGSPETIFIDEIQRLPGLLNTIQALLDEPAQRRKFYLTGSSARKLRRGKANLLPGRIHNYFLGPLVSSELDDPMNAKQALSTGTLPGIWTEPDADERQKTLRSYAGAYVKEEIEAEALTQNIEGFSRFIFAAAAEAGKFLDLTKLASQAQVPRQTAGRFFEILEDTLIVRRAAPFTKNERRRLIQHPRFFFFDTGVLNGLLGNFTASPDRVGILFEHLLFNQITDSAAAGDQDIRISSYRTEHGAEVDFIVEMKNRIFAVEAKASAHIAAQDLRGMKSFTDFFGKKFQPLVAYLGNVPKKINGVEILPWREALQALGL